LCQYNRRGKWEVVGEDALDLGDYSPSLPPTGDRCLDATILAAYARDGGVGVTVIGDGVVVGLRKDGALDILNVDFNGGAPAYASYLQGLPNRWTPEEYRDHTIPPNSRWAAYLAAGYGKRTVTVTTPEYTKVVEDAQQVTIDSLELYRWYPSAEYKAVFLFTDGVHTFLRDNGIGLRTVPMVDVVKELTAIKSSAGEFVTRRCQAFERWCQKNGWHHDDDLGVSAIWIGE
jgi:hypothetical protein